MALNPWLSHLWVYLIIFIRFTKVANWKRSEKLFKAVDQVLCYLLEWPSLCQVTVIHSTSWMQICHPSQESRNHSINSCEESFVPARSLCRWQTFAAFDPFYWLVFYFLKTQQRPWPWLLQYTLDTFMVSGTNVLSKLMVSLDRSQQDYWLVRCYEAIEPLFFAILLYGLWLHH